MKIGLNETPAISVPDYDHSTIDLILQANQIYIKIISDSLNNGWMSPEVKVYDKINQRYQNRLQANLVFLSTLGDVIGTNLTSKTETKRPVGLKNYQSAMDVVNEVEAPVMISVPDPNLKESMHFTAPPVVGRNPELELKSAGYHIIQKDISRKLLVSRFGQTGKKLGRSKVQNLPDGSEIGDSGIE